MKIDFLPFIVTLLGVTLAEMGDKTQLLAMAFAAKYGMKKVLVGITISIILLSATAVIVGNYITRFTTIKIWIQSIAALSFLFFGLWTLRSKKEEDDEEVKARFKLGPVMTVFAAFFIAELGDKTQLATMAFAAQFPQNPIAVFLGGALGLIIANLIGIGLGDFISRKISERTMNIISASAFIIFGLLGCYEVLVKMLNISAAPAIGLVLIIALLVITSAAYIIRQGQGERSEIAIAKKEHK